ncbi:hypothetical protein DMB38_12630 [Streptomyces sp. WAC 06738]|uniref:hypothetical protein n=1 Tax=Streptomyces sp. WAC 06738 TaxID=2203210 RepID=UPI000F6EDA08|nr:hypothetical protein [Streptomyces sp. WAC 06738]AZM46548.1 hypothetical protein DMB38_12630 [Streptomyces sp. WAC 06738]
MTGTRGDRHRTCQLLTLSLAVIAAVATTAVGPGATFADKRAPRDLTPPYYYASLHPETAWAGANVLPLEFDHSGPDTEAELTVDVGGIEGVADITGGADGCRPAKPEFSCSIRLSDDWARQELIFEAAAGARAGDSGVLRYSLKPAGLPAVKGSVTVVAGRPELRVNTGGRVGVKAVGKSFDAPVLIRNEGDVPALGVDLVLDADGTMDLDRRHSNCRYAAGGSAMHCRFPDVEIAPGETFRVAPDPRVKPRRSALDARLSYGAWAFHTGFRRDLPPGRTTRGTAAPLSLARDPGGDAGVEFTPTFDPADVTVPVRNSADVEAIGDFLHGAVGTEHRISIGFRNNGPADPDTAETRAVFTVPPGAEVVKAPYDPELDEEMLPQLCKKEDEGRTYVCTSHGAVGEQVFFDFTLRIMNKDDRPGSVAASTMLLNTQDGVRVRDPEPANDQAPVRMAVPGSHAADGSGLGPAAWGTGAAVTSAAAAALVVTLRRRRNGE